MAGVPPNLDDYDRVGRTFRLEVPARFNYARRGRRPSGSHAGGCLKLGAVPMPWTPLLTSRDSPTGSVRPRRWRRSRMPTAPRRSTRGGGVPKPQVGGGRRGRTAGGAWHDWRTLLERASDSGPDAEPTAADDPMMLYFTSGTTGYPKMVLHTHASYGIGHEITARFWMDLHEGDRHWTVSDTGWA